MKHLHNLGVAFSTFKTAKTLCGKRVSAADLAIDSDADCPHCRAAAENNHMVALHIVEIQEQQYGATDTTRALRATLAQGVTYRNARIGL